MSSRRDTSDFIARRFPGDLRIAGFVSDTIGSIISLTVLAGDLRAGYLDVSLRLGDFLAGDFGFGAIWRAGGLLRAGEVLRLLAGERDSRGGLGSGTRVLLLVDMLNNYATSKDAHFSTVSKIITQTHASIVTFHMKLASSQ